MNGYQRYHCEKEVKKNPLPEYIYEMGRGWYMVRLPDRWVGMFFGIENAARAKRQALNER